MKRIRLMLCLAVFGTALSCKPKIRPDLISGSIQQSLGQKMCDLTAQALGASGGKVLLLMENKGQDKLDACYGYRVGFEAGLKRHPRLSVVDIEMPPFPKEGTERDALGLRLAYYQRLRAQYPDVACFVSFVQAPFFTDEEMEQWDSATMPKIVTSLKMQPRHPWRDLVKHGIVQAVVVPVQQTLPSAEPKGDYKSIFDLYYSVATVENLDKIGP